MSDEFENPGQDDDQVDSPDAIETDADSTDELMKSAVNANLTNGDSEIDETEANDASAIDDPDIMASLKQLSISENADKSTVIHTQESVKNIVEAAIMAASKPLSLDKMLTLFPEGEVVDKTILHQAVDILIEDYQSRGIELVEVSSGFRFQVSQPVAPWVSRLWEEKPQKYSRALLETLALVAYRQPITRGEIEEIRGVSVSSNIMRTLVEREWVRVIGHRDVPGKPAMYATTRQFLDYFGLKKLDELPSLAEIRDLDTINAELDFGDGTKTEDFEETTDDIANDQEQLQITIGNETSGESVNDVTENDERIDIDVELAALKETYKQIDSIEPVEALKESQRSVSEEPASSELVEPETNQQDDTDSASLKDQTIDSDFDSDNDK